MLHAGLDLSRTRLDYCLLDGEGGRVEAGAAPPDGDGLRGFRAARRAAPWAGRVRAAIESMNGARFVHDTLERCGWEVEVADAQKVKGLAPLACKTDRIDAWVLAELSRRDLVPAILIRTPVTASSATSLAEICSHRRGLRMLSLVGRRGLDRSPGCAAACWPTVSIGSQAMDRCEAFMSAATIEPCGVKTGPLHPRRASRVRPVGGRTRRQLPNAQERHLRSGAEAAARMAALCRLERRLRDYRSQVASASSAPRLVGQWWMRRIGSPPAKRRSASISSPTVAETPGIVNSGDRRGEWCRAWRRAAVSRSPSAATRTSGARPWIPATASRPLSGSRMMLEKKLDPARLGRPGRPQIVDSRMANAIDEAAARMV